MLDLGSSKWENLSHAYGNAKDIPKMLESLRMSSEEWDGVFNEAISALCHQGDVFDATYATMPHFVDIAKSLGPSLRSDALLETVAYTSRGGPGPDVPEWLEESWDDAQDDARELIVQRVVSATVSESFGLRMIRGLLYLSGEWMWARHFDLWITGRAVTTHCCTCGKEMPVFNSRRSRTTFTKSPEGIHIPIDVKASSDVLTITIEDDFEFDDDNIPAQLIALACATGYESVEMSVRTLLGEFKCSCGATVLLATR